MDSSITNAGTASRRVALSAMMLVMMALSAQLRIPTPWGIPMTMQTCVLLITILVMGPLSSLGVVAAYLAAGALGFPFFAGWSGGIGVFSGITGGFLVGFLLVPISCALLFKAFKVPGCYNFGLNFRPMSLMGLRLFAASFLSLLPMFCLGVGFMILYHGIPLARAVKLGFLPFIPGALVKTFLALWLYSIFCGRFSR